MPPENGTSFYANALIKAKYISNYLGIPAIGDDSGLEVDAIEGRPGILSQGIRPPEQIWIIVSSYLMNLRI